MGRRSDHSREQIRAMALSAAESIVVHEGPGKLSTRKVARSIGYTAGTLYLVFKNFDDLVLHVNAHTLDDLFDYLQKNVDHTNRSPIESIKSLARAYFDFAQTEYARWSLLFEYHAQEGFENPDWFQEQIRKIFTLVSTQLSLFMPQLDEDATQMTAHALWSGVHGICVLQLSDKLTVVRNVDAVKLTDELVSNFLQGMMKPEEQGRDTYAV